MYVHIHIYIIRSETRRERSCVWKYNNNISKNNTGISALLPFAEATDTNAADNTTAIRLRSIHFSIYF